MVRTDGATRPSGLRRIWRENGLSIVLVASFAITIVGQSLVGHRQYNEEQPEHGGAPIGYVAYLRSSHFLSATMENWESEFLQMFAFVLLTVGLFQKGSAESKDPYEPSNVDRDPRSSTDPNAPGPVRRGGLALRLYEHSLGSAFLVLFLISFALHAVASVRVHNQEQLEHGEAMVSFFEHLRSASFWFESLQNWQSEFLSVAAMVILTIFLRERGSPESKPVDMPHHESGAD